MVVKVPEFFRLPFFLESYYKLQLVAGRSVLGIAENVAHPLEGNLLPSS